MAYGIAQLSWLHNSMQDPTVAPLVHELARLQQELDRANASIDEKLDRLEDAGFGAVDLTKQLEDARNEILAEQQDYIVNEQAHAIVLWDEVQVYGANSGTHVEFTTGAAPIFQGAWKEGE